jgi:hypothetical protein
VAIEYFVVCTARLPERVEGWNEGYGPVSIGCLPQGHDIRLTLEARMDGTDVRDVVVFSSRAAGYLAFQFATALAKLASGMVFDEESLDEALADYRGYPAVALSGGIESIWQSTLDKEQTAEEERARRDLEPFLTSGFNFLDSDPAPDKRSEPSGPPRGAAPRSR